MDELEKYEMEIDRFLDMMEDGNLTSEDYYNAFSEMCIKYNDDSMIPYSICNTLLDEEIPCEEYYMQMLMDVYCSYSIGDDFLELLQRFIDEGYCDEYQKVTHELIKNYIKDGYVIAYRGEFATEEYNNLDYTESVSYSLDYEEAKFFATRFNMLSLKKSVVHTVKVPIGDVLAYIERENEIVCIPKCMGGRMELLKTESIL